MGLATGSASERPFTVLSRNDAAFLPILSEMARKTGRFRATPSLARPYAFESTIESAPHGDDLAADSLAAAMRRHCRPGQRPD
jgi:hypothetical protein